MCGMTTSGTRSPYAPHRPRTDWGVVLRVVGAVLFVVGLGLAIPLTSGFMILFLMGGMQSGGVMATLAALLVTGVVPPPTSAPLLVFGCALMVLGGVALIAWVAMSMPRTYQR